jgi:molybdopterin converting factor subunit 1
MMAGNDDSEPTVTVKVLFFASAREAANGLTRIDLQVPVNSNTLSIRRILADRFPKLATTVLDEDSLTLALNEEYVAAGQVIPIQNGDTVALIPPISGG